MGRKVEELIQAIIGQSDVTAFNVDKELTELSGFQLSQDRQLALLNYLRKMSLQSDYEVSLSMTNWALLRQCALKYYTEAVCSPANQALPLCNHDLFTLLFGLPAFLGDPEIQLSEDVSNCTLFLDCHLQDKARPARNEPFTLESFDLFQSAFGGIASYAAIDLAELVRTVCSNLNICIPYTDQRSRDLALEIFPTLGEANLNEAMSVLSMALLKGFNQPYWSNEHTQFVFTTMKLMSAYANGYGIRVNGNAIKVFQHVLSEKLK